MATYHRYAYMASGKFIIGHWWFENQLPDGECKFSTFQSVNRRGILTRQSLFYLNCMSECLYI